MSRRMLILIIGLPALSVILGILMFVLASRVPDPDVQPTIAPLSKTNP